MARQIWKGTLSFGLVEIPVALHGAEAREELRFTMLDSRDLAPVGYVRVNKASGEEVPWNDIVKGYEYEEGRYVLVGDEDFRRANAKATQTVQILDFIDAKEIDPIHFDTPYYLSPLRRSSKGYALLRETLRRTGKAGIATVVLRTRQYLSAVFVRGDVLVVQLLRYAHEIRSAKDLEVPGNDLEELGVTEREIGMAERLVEGMTTAWEPERYHDSYRDDLLAFIERKVKAGELESVEPIGEPAREAANADIVDLMPLLKKSLERAERPAEREKPAARGAGRSTRAPTRTPARAPARAAAEGTQTGRRRVAAARKPPAPKKRAS